MFVLTEPIPIDDLLEAIQMIVISYEEFSVCRCFNEFRESLTFNGVPGNLRFTPTRATTGASWRGGRASPEGRLLTPTPSLGVLRSTLTPLPDPVGPVAGPIRCDTIRQESFQEHSYLKGITNMNRCFRSFPRGMTFMALCFIAIPVHRLGAADLGDSVIRRSEFDGGTGQLWVYAGNFPNAGEIVTTWSFFNDGSATNSCATGAAGYFCYPGASITPVILEKTATSTFRVTGIGTTRVNSLSGAQTYSFGLVAGSAVVGANSTFGFRSGGPTDTGDFDFGVVQFDNAPSLGFYYFGERVQLTVGNDYNGTGPSRAYSIKFTTAPAPQQFQICPLFDQTKPVKSGAAIPIKLQLCRPDGTNLSSPNIIVHATSLMSVSSGTSASIQDAGGANPDNDFRYSDGLYIFNLKTTGLETGTYRLSFTAGSPVTYFVQFQVK